MKPLELHNEQESQRNTTTASPRGQGEQHHSLPPISYQTTPSEHFQNESFAVAPSNIAGCGAFAKRDLHRGDVILRERPLFVATSETLFREFEGLDRGIQAVAMDLYANEGVKVGTPKLLAIWRTNW